MHQVLSFQIHGGADHGGGVAETVAKFLSYLEQLAEQSPMEIFSSVMPGISALANIHPLLVHFPLALLSIFFIVDLSGTIVRKNNWRILAGWFLYFGTILAALTVISGLLAESTVPHGDNVHSIMETHEQFGITVLTLASILSIWRLKSGHLIEGAANTLYLIMAALMCMFMILGADLGGLMVYRYGVAVENVAVPDDDHSHSNSDDHQHQHSH